MLKLFVSLAALISCYMQKCMVGLVYIYAGNYLRVHHPVIFLCPLYIVMKKLCSDSAIIALFWDEPHQVCLRLGYFLISVGTLSVLQVLGDRLTEVVHLHLLTSLYMWPKGGFSFTYSTSKFHYFAYSAQVVRLRPSLDSLWEVICV